MASRMVSLTVIANEDQEAKQTFEMLCQIGAELSMTHHYASVSTVDPDEVISDEDEPKLYHDENTLDKIYKILAAHGLSRQKTTAIVNGLQNAGILFRERMPDAS